MIEAKKINIDGIDFMLNPMKVFTALRLDKKVISLLLPAMKGLSGSKLDDEVDFGEILAALGESLEKMSDAETEKFFVEILQGVQIMEPGQPVKEVTPDVIGTSFQGKLMTLYKLVGEVMKFNKFTPFEMLQAGGLMSLINGSESLKSPSKKPPGISDRLVSSEDG